MLNVGSALQNFQCCAAPEPNSGRRPRPVLGAANTDEARRAGFGETHRAAGSAGASTGRSERSATSSSTCGYAWCRGVQQSAAHRSRRPGLVICWTSLTVSRNVRRRGCATFHTAEARWNSSAGSARSGEHAQRRRAAIITSPLLEIVASFVQCELESVLAAVRISSKPPRRPGEVGRSSSFPRQCPPGGFGYSQRAAPSCTDTAQLSGSWPAKTSGIPAGPGR